MKKTPSYLLFFLLVFLCTQNIFAQLDNLHYLPPLKQVTHGNKNNPPAIKQQSLYLSTPVPLAEKFSVRVYKGNTLLTTLNDLSKGNSIKYDLPNGDNDISLVSNAKTGVVITEAGLRLESINGEKFYVNYRGRSGAQAGSLTSKGARALGTDFRWGGIPNRANNANLTTSLGMMATEDGTVVQVFGYDSGCQFRFGGGATNPLGFTIVGGYITDDALTIPLNKGESFVLEAPKNRTTSNIDGWLGASVTSNKPIVISNGGLNVGIRTTSASRDVGIDQPVATNALGREYVFVRGNGSNETEFPIIVGTQNGTNVYAGGNFVGTVNNGGYLEIPGTFYSSATAGANMYVTTSKDAYAYQCLQGKSGNSIQTIGMNFIAPVNCLLPDKLDEVGAINNIAGLTNNVEAALTIIASTSTPNANIVVRQNGVAVSLPAPVLAQGTSDWKTFFVNNLSGDVDVQSTGPIAVGTFMTDQNNAGLAGYFSGFDTVPVVEVELTGGGCFPGSDLEETTGNFDAYQWYYNNSPVLGANNSTLVPFGLGDYYVEVTKGTCSYNSAVVSVYNCDPDIVVKKTADTNGILEGEDVTFTVTVQSLGLQPVTNLVINDAFPAGLNIGAVTPSTGTWTQPNWSIGTMNAGEIHTLTLVGSAPAGSTGGDVTNIVSNTQDQTETTNQTPDDFSEDVTIFTGGITIDKSFVLNDGGDGVQAGDTVDFTFTVKNTGGTFLKDIIVDDPKLGGAISGPASGDGDSDGNLDQTETWIYTKQYTITTADVIAEKLENIATVDSKTPTNISKNAISNKVEINFELADLSISKTPSNTAPRLGDELTFTIRVINSSDDNATGVAIEDVLPIGYTYVAGSATNSGSHTSSKITWSGQTIFANTSKTFTYKVTVNPPTVLPNYPANEYENTVQITASDIGDPDSIPNNNIGIEDDQAKVVLPVEADYDKDGVNDSKDLDNDNDGILDSVEDANTDGDNNPKTNPTDTDNDGTPDYLDTDSDGDGCLDAIEANGNFTSAEITSSSNLADEDEGSVGADGVPTNTGSPQATTTGVTIADAMMIDTQPIDVSICTATSTTFTVAASGTRITDYSVTPNTTIAVPTTDIRYQWQVSSDAGGTYTNLSDGGIYTGTSTVTLMLTNAVNTLNNNRYKVLVTSINNSCALESSEATLTFKATPNPPTIIDPQEFCGPSTVSDLTASIGSGEELVWYDAATGGNLLADTTALASGDYYAASRDLTTGCVSPTTKATVIVKPVPSINQGTVTQISTCGGSDGSIALTNLTANTAYSVTYNKDSNPTSLTNALTDGSGNLLISSLPPGTYTDIQVTLNGCVSNTLSGPIVLAEPTPAAIAFSVKTDPTTCGGSDGTIVISGLENSASYSVSYEKDGTPTSPTITSSGTGTISLTGLPSGSYTNISVTKDNCTSNILSTAIVLMDPTAPNLGLSKVNDPVTCTGQGSLEFIGLGNTQNYTFSYILGGTNFNLSLTSDASGTLVVPNLDPGTYENMSVTIAGCTSNTVARAVISPPVISLGMVTNPTQCTGTGTIELEDLVSNTGYTLSYILNGASSATTKSVTSNNSGVITITDLGAGTYTDIKVIDGNNCSSNSIASVQITTPAVPNLLLGTVTNPDSCVTNSGSIQLTGLNTNTSYEVVYTLDGSATPVTQTLGTNSSSEIVLSNLSAGAYTDIKVTEVSTNCESTSVSATLTVPPSPSAPTVIDPQEFCGPSTVNDLTASIGSGEELVWYDAATGGNLLADTTALASGDYYAASRDLTTGCVSPTTKATVIVKPVPSINQGTVTQISTCGGSDGSIALTNLTANTAYSVTYNKDSNPTSLTNALTDGSGNLLISSLPPGTYTDIQVTLNGCVSNTLSGPIVLAEPTPAAIAFSVKTDPTTCGGSDGTIVISGLENSASYSVSYEKDGTPTSPTITSSGTGTISLTGLPSGSYTNISVTKDNCTSNILSTAIVLMDPTAPNLGLSKVNDPVTCTGQGSLEFIGLGNTQNYTFSYTLGGTNFNLSLTSDASGTLVVPNLDPGTYENMSVTIAGCTSNTVARAVISPPVISLGMVTNPTQCTGTGTIELEDLVSNTGYTLSYILNGASSATTKSVTSNNSGVITITDLGAGTYTDIKVIDGNNCSSNSIASVQITTPAVPNLLLGTVTNPDSCVTNSGSIQLTGLNTNTSYEVVYTLDGSATPVTQTLGTNSSSEIVLSNLSAGAYTDIKVTEVSTNCESTSVSATLTVPPSPSAPTVIDPQEFCGPSTVNDLTASIGSGEELVWYDAATGGNLLADTTALASGDYYAASRDLTTGCVSPTTKATVIVKPVPSINQGTVTQISTCGGSDGSIALTNLTANTAYSVTYNKDSNPTSLTNALTDGSGNLLISSLPPGTYTDIQVTLNGCVSNTLSGPIVLAEPTPAAIAFSVKTDPTTCGGSDGTIVISGLENSASYSVSYEKDGTPTSPTITSSGTGTISLTGLPSGSYTNISVTKDNCTSNILSTAIVLMDPTAPNLGLSKVNDPVTCTGQGSLEFIGLGNTQNYTFSYTLGGTNFNLSLTSDASGTLVVPNLDPGTYENMSVTIAGCTSNTVARAVISPPVISLGMVTNPTQCTGTGTIELEDLVSNTGYTLSYILNGASSATTKSVTSNNSGVITITDLGAGTYTDIKVIDGNNCSSNSIASVQITTPAVPNLLLGTVTNPDSCVTNSGSIQLTGLNTNTSYEVVYTLDGSATPVTQTLGTNSSSEIVLSNLSAGAYTDIKVTEVSTNCESTSVSATLTVPPSPSAPTVIDPQEFCGPSTVNDLTASIGSGEELVWYDAATGGNLLADTTALASGDYYAASRDLTTGCVSPTTKATVIVKPVPSINQGTVTQISTCGGSDGSIALTNLTANTAYSVTYNKDSNPTSLTNALTDGSGNLLISSLPPGTYTDIQVTLNGCVSNTLSGPIVLAEPTPAAIAFSVKTDPTTCGGSDGTIVISGLENSASYSVSYEKDGTPTSPTITSSGTGTISLTGLPSGSYTNISVTKDNCTSNILSTAIVLMDPTAPNLGLSKVNDPVTCTGQGSLEFIGLGNTQNYTFSYTLGGTNFNLSLTSDASGTLVVPNLDPGTYENMSVTIAGCTSNTVARAVISPPVISLGMVTNPTQCTGTGTIELEDLVSNTGYTLSYILNGASSATTKSVTSNNSGVITITDLGAGTYTDIKVIDGNNCSSNSIASVQITTPAVPNLLLGTVTNPDSCVTNSGSIQLTGLNTNTSYEVVYTLDGSATPVTQTLGTNSSSEIVLSNLSAGAYTDIKVTEVSTNCESTSVSATLTVPPSPSAPTVIDPQEFCGPSTVNDLTASIGSGEELVWYDAATGGNLLADTTALASGDYYAASRDLTTGCVSPTTKATVIVKPVPSINQGAVTQISTCGGSDGSIALTGLENSAIYSLTYKKDGGEITKTISSDVSGIINISNLLIGTYTDFKVDLNGCTSNTLPGPIIVSEPISAMIGFVSNTNPTTCGGSDGTIVISGLENGENYALTYKENSVDKNINITADASGNYTIAGLASGNYTAISVTKNDCTSNILSTNIVLMDPTAPNFSLSKVNDPTTCVEQGSIEFVNLSPSTNYTFNFTQNGVILTRSVTSDTNGALLVGNLDPGTYENMSVTIAGCISNTIARAVINPPVISLGTVTNSTVCNGTGTFEIKGLVNSSGYTVQYMLAGNTITQASTSTSNGSIIVTGLNAGTYTDVKVLDGNNCISNSIASVVISVPVSPIITLGTVTNSSSCDTGTGSLQLKSLISNTAYTVSYTLNGTVTNQSLSTDAIGEIVLSNLTDGNYTNIKVTDTSTNCDSNILSAVIENPSAPNQPTVNSTQEFCGPSTIGDLVGSVASGEELIWFDAAMNGNLLDNSTVLTSTNYYAASKDLSTGCISNTSVTSVTINVIPAITEGVISQITTCDGTNGGIQLTGLANATTYNLSYKKNGATVNSTSTTDGSGNIQISNLSEGNYIDFQVSLNGCMSNILSGPFVLNEPTPAVINLVSNSNPTSCGGNDGTIMISGLENGGNYTLTYKENSADKNVTITADGSGNYALNDLSAGNYTNISVVKDNCTSNVLEAVVLSDPMAANLVLEAVNNPMTCSGNGSIEFLGLAVNTSHSFVYTFNGTETTVALNSDANGKLIVPSLAPGLYENMYVVTAGCTSNTIARAVINPPVISLGEVVQPTQCTGTGSFEVLGLVENEPYNLVYTFNETVVDIASTSNASGSIVTMGLAVGTYTNIQVRSTDGCLSNTLASVDITSPASPNITLGTVVNSTSCSVGNGSFQISSLTANTSYQLSYEINGSSITKTVGSDTNGTINVVNVLAGNYTNIKVVDVSTSCTSNVLTATITEPVSPNVPTAMDQVFCGSSTISDIIGTVASGEELIWYDAMTGGNLLPNNSSISTGIYYAASRSLSTGCISNRVLINITVNACSNLSMEKVISNNNPNVGDEVTFTILLKNDGPDPATGVGIEDNLPIGYGNINLITQGGTLTNNKISWSNLNVPLTGLALTYKATVKTPTGVSGEYTNIAQVTASNSQDIDSTPNNDDGDQSENDEASNTISVEAVDLSLSKTVSDNNPNVGDILEFTLTIANDGPSIATGVGFEDTLPVGLTYQVTSASNNGIFSAFGNKITWSDLTIPVSGSIKVTYKVKVKEPTVIPVPVNEYKNVAQITASDVKDLDSSLNNDDGDQSEDDEANVNVTIQIADLSLAKTVSNSNPNVGDTIDFTLTLSNKGPDNATNVEFVDKLPVGLTYVASSASNNGVYNVAENTLTWSGLNIDTNKSADVTYQVKVNKPSVLPISTTEYKNIAQVTKSDQYDPNSRIGNDNGSQLEDDEAAVSIVPQVSDLSITKTVNTSDANVGDIIQFTIIVKNDGPDDATNVKVKDELPIGFDYVSDNVNGAYNDATGLWTIGVIANQASATLIMDVKVLTPTGAAGEYLNIAEVSEADQYDPDSDSGNGTTTNGEDDDDSSTINLIAVELAVTKTVDSPNPTVNDEINFTITITNNGPGLATNIILNETLPSGYQYISHTTTTGIYDEFTGDWSIASLADKAVTTLVVKVKVREQGDYENNVSITQLDQLDSNPSNNSGSSSTTPICLTIYNEFTPNDDGINDVFVIDCIEQYPNNVLEVFNRWGNTVFKMKNYNNSWNGTSNGRATINTDKKLPVGTYYYVLDLGNGITPQKGWIYINR
ncbi:putative repeat protein (TIGR01451 family)/gliding motility-associated-like protein [Lutibacter sp. Hel_I_33_5]|uniref:Ig-like domain-containing protein n=1 Tax=Lutibacter sp. Hel_I_33_5 TaxID=1566289 RepID=UPI0011A3C717|nr:gliding motility-associated C-terminal domain-containing protein [Lutibacter sp. Hel_I_33_5]TVZ55679.1 putative repeat protein (TIGR01451 family)/gliding motility-associated-like protein [Lutibacter sp. Hel_I_33_5]